MRRSRVVGPIIGVILVASACAAPAGVGSGFGVAPSPDPDVRSLTRAERDSLAAQSIADRDGPRVNISAMLSTASGSRNVIANFHADDDAYVLVGHIDADGILRISFPIGPRDDGFVRGQASYATPEFFAGFTSEYAYRARTSYARYRAPQYDSYDGGFGYVFIIASWRPMHFDRFSTDGAWDSFELADPNYMNDPRPAVYELASLLVGDAREAYTVKFAHYTTTQTIYGGYGNDYASSAYGVGYCPGFAPIGFVSSPFDIGSPYSLLAAYGESFWYRGDYYAYSPAGDCYASRHGGFGLGYAVPFVPQSKARAFNLTRRSPLSPKPPPLHLPPIVTAGGGTAGGSQVTAEYRQRGLIPTDDPTRGHGRQANATMSAPTNDQSRPSIQQMVTRHANGANNGGGWSRARMSPPPAGTISQGWSRPVPEGLSGHVGPSGVETRVYTSPAPSSGARTAPSYSPAPHMTSPAPMHSAPSPSAGAATHAASSPPPASSSSSTGSKPPK
jgi:hypothetical protein